MMATTPSTLAVEILQHIFLDLHWGEDNLNAAPKCMAFMLACHRWYEVATSLPELWTRIRLASPTDFRKYAIWINVYSGGQPLDCELTSPYTSYGSDDESSYFNLLNDFAMKNFGRIRTLHLRRLGTGSIDLIALVLGTYTTSHISNLTLEERVVEDSEPLEHIGLDLDFSSLRTLKVKNMDLLRLKRIEFPVLETFHWSGNADISDWRYLGEFFPHLQTLRLDSIKFTGQEDPMPSPLKHLTRLTILVYDDIMAAFPMKPIIFEACPNVTHLEVEPLWGYMARTEFLPLVPSLESLVIQNWQIVDSGREQVRRFRKLLDWIRMDQPLKHLTIIQQRDLFPLSNPKPTYPANKLLQFLHPSDQRPRLKNLETFEMHRIHVWPPLVLLFMQKREIAAASLRASSCSMSFFGCPEMGDDMSISSSAQLTDQVDSTRLMWSSYDKAEVEKLRDSE